MRVALAIALLLLPGVASAARLTAVRVGVHAGYARVVLETDAAAEYELIGASAAAPGEVTVRIAATSRAREVRSSIGGAPVVALFPQDDGSTLATIRASGPLRVETQVLSAPPRVVLDLHRVAADASPPPAPDAAAKPEPVAEAEAATPAAAPEAAPIPDPPPNPTPAPVAATPESPVVAPPAAEEEAPPLPPVAAAAPSNRLDAPSLALGVAVGLGLAFFGFASRGRRSRPVAIPAPVEAIESLPPPPEAAELSQQELEDITPFPRREPPPSAAWFESLPEPTAEPEALEALPLDQSSAPPFPRSEPEASGETHQDVPAEAPPNAQISAPLFPRSEPTASGEIHQAGEIHDLDLLRMHQRLDARLAEIADRLGDLVERQAKLEARGAAQNEELASQRAAIARLQRSLRPAATQARPLQVP